MSRATLSAADISKPQARAARIATSAVFFANGAVIATWVVRLPGVQADLKLSPALVGTALLGLAVGSLIAMPQTGALAARYGTRRVTITAGLLMMLALLLPFLALNLYTLFAALMVLGACNGVMDVAMNAQGVAVERSLGQPVMSSFHAAYSLGNLAGAGLGSLLLGAALGGFPHALIVTLSMGTALLIAGPRLLPRHADEPPKPAETENAAPPTSTPNSLIWLLGALCFMGMLGEGALGDWSGLYSRDVLGATGARIGAGYTGFTLAMTVARAFGDGWRGRYGDGRVVTVGALLSGLGLGLSLLSSNYALAFVGFLAFGLGVANVVPVLYSAAGSSLAGRGIARVATLGYAGFLVGPPLIGFVSQATSLRGGMVVIALSLVLVGLMAPTVYGRMGGR